jgi:putative transposase
MKLIDCHNILHPYKGVLQMQDYLGFEGYSINEKRVRRLMRKMCIEAMYPKVNLSRLGKAKYIRPYLLRHLDIVRPNQVWAIDISYIPMKKGFMYLTAVIDWYSRCIVGWQLSNTLEAETQTELVKKLIDKHGKPEIINSDQGSQYTCSNWINTMKMLGISISMDGRGRATDNAVIERFFRTIKQEQIYLNPEEKVNQLKQGLAKYISYYNTERTHQGIDRNIPINLYQEKVKKEENNTTKINQLVV